MNFGKLLFLCHCSTHLGGSCEWNKIMIVLNSSYVHQYRVDRRNMLWKATVFSQHSPNSHELFNRIFNRHTKKTYHNFPYSFAFYNKQTGKLQWQSRVGTTLFLKIKQEFCKFSEKLRKEIKDLYWNSQ